MVSLSKIIYAFLKTWISKVQRASKYSFCYEKEQGWQHILALEHREKMLISLTDPGILSDKTINDELMFY